MDRVQLPPLSRANKGSNETSQSGAAPQEKRRRRRKRPLDPEANKAQVPMFSHFALNKDPQVAKYMPYNEVAYPKLERINPSDQSNEELASMWMVGFLDHVEQNAVEILKEEAAPFLQLPGEGILPSAKKHLRLAEKRKNKDKKKTQKVSASKGAAQPHGKGDGAPDSLGHRKALTDEERMRLEALAKELEGGRSLPKAEAILQVYKRENRRIRRALEGKNAKRKQQTIVSDHMSHLFEITRSETQAAIAIQRAWRRFVTKRFWRLRIFQMLRVKKIQALARGYITRRLVAQWFRERRRLTIQWQARIRKHLDLKHWKLGLAVEQRAVVHPQRLVRGFLGRCRFRFIERSLAAARIQALWRGCVGRAVADQLWLEPRVILIQAIVRGFLGRKDLTAGRTELDECALRVQRSWRGFWSRRRRNHLLFDRETMYREDVINELSSEKSHYADLLAQLQRKADRDRFDEKISGTLRALNGLHHHIRETEVNWLELQRQKQMVSPRALQQGWREELTNNIIEHREMLTAHKIKAMFTHSLALRKLQHKQQAQKKRLGDVAYNVSKCDEWREEEIQDALNRQNRHKHDNDAKERQQKTADQRRRWAIRFYTPAGKPDKKRRPGRPWDKSVLAGPERETYCGAGSDIFAFNQSVEKLRMGSDESLQRVMSRVQTQNFLNEVQSMDALLAPLAKPFQQTQHDKPLWKEKLEAEKNESYPWLPTKAEMGVKYHAETEPPRDPSRPPHVRGFPSPRALEADRVNEEPDEATVDDDEQSEQPIDNAETSLLEEEKDRRVRRNQRAKDRMDKLSEKRPRHERRRREVVSRIPWNLLDELEHEKWKFKAEKALEAAFGT